MKLKDLRPGQVCGMYLLVVQGQRVLGLNSHLLSEYDNEAWLTCDATLGDTKLKVTVSGPEQDETPTGYFLGRYGGFIRKAFLVKTLCGKYFDVESGLQIMSPTGPFTPLKGEVCF